MSNGRGARRNSGADKKREEGWFIAFPVCVFESQAYLGLTRPARDLLIEIAIQYRGNNNGRLLASKKQLEGRGWKSSDLIVKAKRELIEAKFIHETVMGQRPNKASWYAVTWWKLDKHPGFDDGAHHLFKLGAYRLNEPLKLAAKGAAKRIANMARIARAKNAPLTSSAGVEEAPIAPWGGVEAPPATPLHGPVMAQKDPPATPPHGNHLNKPSALLKPALPAPPCLPQ